MLNSKQRAALRAEANSLETILQIGKDGISPETEKQLRDALKARELIKIRVLKNQEMTAREAADALAGNIDAEVVQVIGTKIVFYRRNPEKKGYDHCL